MKFISIYEVTGEKSLIDPEIGKIVFNEIRKALENDEKVQLSFEQLTRCTVGFLNIAIGKLYDPELNLADKADTLLTFCDVDEYDADKCHKVIEYAKTFYNDKSYLEENDK